VSALLCCVCSSSRSRGVLWCDTGGSPHLSLSPRERKKDRKERMETKRGPCLRGSGSTVRLNKGNSLSFSRFYSKMGYRVRMELERGENGVIHGPVGHNLRVSDHTDSPGFWQHVVKCQICHLIRNSLNAKWLNFLQCTLFKRSTSSLFSFT
jgi:hypothetical protein